MTVGVSRAIASPTIASLSSPSARSLTNTPACPGQKIQTAPGYVIYANPLFQFGIKHGVPYILRGTISVVGGTMSNRG